MRTNADLTLYSKSVDPATRSEVWMRKLVIGVFWEERKAANVIKSGLLEADSVSVYIPMARGPLAIKAGDVLVKGLVADEISAAFTITQLKAKYPHVVTVRSVDEMSSGSMALRHWEVGAA